MRNYFYLIITLIIFLSGSLFSCKEHINESLLLEAQEEIETNPDSSIILLDSIVDPEEMNKSRYMDYIVTKTQAKHKTYNDISEDTLIFQAKKYFENEKLFDKAALAYFYAGCVRREQKTMDKAIRDYLQAFDYAKQMGNNKLMGLSQYYIGDIYYKQDLPDSAANHYKMSLSYYNNIEKSDLIKISLYNQIANALFVASKLQKPQLDTVLAYYQKGLDLAIQSNNIKAQGTIMRQIGVNLREAGEYSNAQKYLYQALSIAQTPLDSTLVYLNLAKTYKMGQKYDSAKYFTKPLEDLLLRVDDNYIHHSAYNYLSSLYEELDDYKSALKYSHLEKNYLQEASDQERTIEVLDMEKKYNFAKKEKELLQYQIREQYLVAIAAITILLLLVAGLLIKVIHDRHKHEKEINKQLNKQVDNILYLNKVYRNLRLAFYSFEKEIETLLISYGIKEKSAGYDQIRLQFKKINKVAEESLGELTLDFLESKKVNQEILSNLKANDLLFLSLLLCGYEPKEIAIILGVNMHTLQMRKIRLTKKLKDLGLSDSLIDQYFT